VRSQKFNKEKDFDSIQAFVHPGIVHWPQYLNVKVLPQEYKEWVTSEFEEVKAEFEGGRL
jgi:hypothetical protein